MRIQRIRNKHQLYATRMAMRKLAAPRVFGEQMPALQLYGFTDTKHGRTLSKRGLHLF